jgi:pimeloyl-ACP methyl ester carboxylesterase
MIEAVEVPRPGGLVLRGQLRPGGADWVVLVHAPAEDIDAWLRLPGRFASQGASVLALDLRGHGGSDGSPDPAATAGDVRAAIGFARGEGAGRVFVGAAGESVVPALEAAEEERCEAVFALAPVGDQPVTGIPRFAVVCSRDAEQEAAGATLVAGPGWSVVARIPVDVRGCAMLGTSWGGNVEDYLLAFVRDRRRMPRPALA